MLWIALALVVLAVTGDGVLQNARYGMRLDVFSGSQDFTFPGITVGSFGVTFAILDLFKAMVPISTIEAWRPVHRVIATVVFICFVGLAGLSIWNITALQIIARDDKEATQQVERQ